MGNGEISRRRAFTAKVLGLFGRREGDSEFDEEVQEHLQLLVERFVAQGMSREDAKAAARRQFGNTTRLREDRRELRTLVSVEDLWRDLRYALRSLGRSRAITCSIGARWFLGFRVTNMKPPLALLPAKATSVATAGSEPMIRTSWRMRWLVMVNELDWSDCRPPIIWPVSCCGKKPFGVMTVR